MTLIVGIDASLSRTAVAVGWGPEVATIYKIEVPAIPGSIRNRFIRYQSIVNRVMECCRTFDTPTIFLEGYNFGSKTSAVVLAEFGGLLRASLLKVTESGGEIIEVPPKSLKSFVAENGNANKPMMAAASRKRWGVKYATDDEVDAYGLWRFGRAYLGLDEGLSIAQLNAIRAVKNPVKKVTKRKEAIAEPSKKRGKR